jgi:glycine cleavage system H lipoate-binding protein
MAHPNMEAAEVDGIPLPGWLKYSTNHMWLDVTGDGVCHAGIDAFLSRALGKIERISYVWLKGRHRPTAVLTVEGLDLEVVFPNPFLLTNCNLYLRADPSRLISQPYTGGWLFEGVPEPGALDNLLQGAGARAWMEREQHRINEFLQQQHQQAADGGQFVAGLARILDRDQLLALFHEFFSPYGSEKREP